MSAGPRGTPSAEPAGERLDSWKEIAAYLGREVRTVQGWEKSEGLPVHRHLHARQGSVYAFKSELDAWRGARRGIPGPAPIDAPVDAPLVAANSSSRLALLAGSLLLLAIVGAGLWWMNRTPRISGDVPSSVVVLPFLDMSPRHDQEYFSDGLTEELIDALTRVPNLRVVARTSSFAFKGKAADIREIGRQLNVNAVLEGSVRKSGDELRITAQLARVSDGYHFWSHTYDRRLSDVFAVQREISQAIADLLRAGQIPQRHHAPDMEAYRLYQEGKYLFNKFEVPQSNWKAIERYQQALRRDPSFAPAYAGMSDAYAYLAENFVVAPKEVMPKAREAAEKAVALDDSLAEAHTALGTVKLDFDRDREGAQREFLRALQLNPGSSWAHHWYAHSLETQGLLAEATREMRTALDLDPLSIPVNWDVASDLLAAGHVDEALQHLQKAGDLFPNVPVFPFLKIQAYLEKQDRDSARRVVETWKAANPEWKKDPLFLSMFGVEAVLGGRRKEAQEMLDRMDALRKFQYVDAFMGTPVSAALRDGNQLRTWLRRADEERSPMFVYLPLLKDFFHLDAKVVAEFAK